MTEVLYVYDCRDSRRSNARRVSFTKELYGFVYTWKTKGGVKERKRPGLLDQCFGAVAIADSTILVPEEHRSAFDSLFRVYSDVAKVRIYRILEEIRLV
jgi:hypothetical protein